MVRLRVGPKVELELETLNRWNQPERASGSRRRRFLDEDDSDENAIRLGVELELEDRRDGPESGRRDELDPSHLHRLGLSRGARCRTSLPLPTGATLPVCVCEGPGYIYI